MKKDIHPMYQEVVFIDSSSGKKFVCGTASQSKQKGKSGVMEIPVSISSASHPYFVGGKQFIDTEGRVDRFNKRYQQKSVVAAPKAESVVETPVVAAVKKSAVKKETTKKTPAKKSTES